MKLRRFLLAWILTTGVLVDPVRAASAPIALIQLDADRDFGDVSGLRKREVALAQSAVDRGARVIVFPEGSSTGYADRDRVWCMTAAGRCAERQCVDVMSVAESVPDGASTRFWEAWAKARGVYVVFWIPERAEGQVYNTLVAVGPQGFVTRYRKRDLYYLDRCWAQPGQSPAVLSTPYGDFGLMVCMDGQDYGGTFYSEYRQLGADAILIPMDWDDDPEGLNSALVTFRKQARIQSLPIYAADVAAWDGTGLYPAGGGMRLRSGLSEPAVGVEGVALVPSPRSR